jgi:hypothetical protein
MNIGARGQLTKLSPHASIEHSRNRAARTLPNTLRGSRTSRTGRLREARLPACHHVALLLTPEALLRPGLNPAAKVFDLKERFRCRGCGRMGGRWFRSSARERPDPPRRPGPLATTLARERERRRLRTLLTPLASRLAGRIGIAKRVRSYIAIRQQKVSRHHHPSPGSGLDVECPLENALIPSNRSRR